MASQRLCCVPMRITFSLRAVPVLSIRVPRFGDDAPCDWTAHNLTCEKVSDLLENPILAIEEQGFTMAVCPVRETSGDRTP
jgi:hypothetical protein